jgi:hypothetical protein
MKLAGTAIGVFLLTTAGVGYERLAIAGDSQPAPAASPASKVESDVRAQRAQDAERRRQYMAGIASSFVNEKVDFDWSTRVAARITAAFEARDGLRNRLRDVECRAHTCRVKMDEDQSLDIPRQMPFVSLALADVLPSMSVDYVDQGNGHRTMILYLSSQSTARPAER